MIVPLVPKRTESTAGTRRTVPPAYKGGTASTHEPKEDSDGSSLGQHSGDATASHEDDPAAAPGPVVSVAVPLALRALGNPREHPLARARRTRREIAAVLEALKGCTPPPLTAVALLMRVGWNRLDVDGLVASMKGPIDALARWFASTARATGA